MGEKSWKYVGIDESNHGRYPEIYVAAYSNFESDTENMLKPEYPKIRVTRKDKNFSAKLGKRDYNFLILDQHYKRFICSYKFMGIVVASLLDEEIFELPLRLFIDGRLSKEKEEGIRGIVGEQFGIRDEGIEIKSGKDLDRRLFLVNLADEAAYWLYKKPLEKLAKHRKKKTILTDLLIDNFSYTCS